MKIGLIHLTDLHISKGNMWLDEKVTYITSALKTEFQSIDILFITITGDLAFSGKEEEYVSIHSSLIKLKSLLSHFYKELKIEFIIIPGNHDCDFTQETQVRIQCLKNIGYENIGKDNSIIELCSEVQKDFWEFNKKLTKRDYSKKIFEEIIYTHNDFTICFNCLNSAWMSSLEEKPGSLFFPIKNIIPKQKSDINITLIHHPINWFNPNTLENNSIEIKDFIDQHSDIVLLAHEHTEDSYTKITTKTEKEIYYRHGTAFFHRDNKIVTSGFKIFKISLTDKLISEKEFNWNEEKNLYLSKNPIELDFNIVDKKRHFKNKEEFISNLNSVKIPLSFQNKNNVSLSDIYIFPDLDLISSKENNSSSYTDSEKLVDLTGRNLILLEGDNQSGKTSLIEMLYLNSINLNHYPLIIQGEDIKNSDIEKIIEKTFHKQYKEESYEEYHQYDNRHKLLFIDNIQNCKLNNKALRKIIDNLYTRFSNIIITSSLFSDSFRSFENEENFKNYKILPFGHEKRNELIDRYHRINNQYDNTIQDQDILDKVKFSFDQVQTVLGNKLIPSYPIFILTIIQNLEETKSINPEQTSYGFCYQMLITYALLKKSNVKDDLETYINLLTEFAFSLYETKQESFSEEEFRQFYNNYCNTYIVPSLEEIKLKLLQSGLLLNTSEDYYKFTYEYINYYLAARKISQIIHTEKGKELVKLLCNSMHKKTEANILIFLAHHTKSDFLIEEATISSMLPFEKYTPITLDKNDDYFTLIQSIIQDFNADVIDESKKPQEVRKNRMKQIDKIEREYNLPKEKDDEDEDFFQSEEVIAFHQSLKALEIVGQIIKNGKGSIDKTKLITMIEELYKTGFRIVAFFGELTKNLKEDWVQVVLDDIDENDSKSEIESKIVVFLHAKALEFCLAVFSKMIYSIGCKDLKPLYNEVAKKIDSPAAKLISFGIKLYYSKLSIDELKILAQDFSNNKVALQILKANVKNYVYNNKIDYKQRQIIEDKLNIRFLPTAIAKKGIR